MQLYTAAKQACMSAADPSSGVCRNCTAQTFDPDKVMVQALQGNCADPLGELARSDVSMFASAALQLVAGAVAGSFGS
jgi:hypothetical protein